MAGVLQGRRRGRRAQLPVHADPLRQYASAALSMYGVEPCAFDDEARALAESFADYAGVALANACTCTRAPGRSQRAQTAMESRAVIRQTGQGVLIGQRHCTAGGVRDPRQAFAAVQPQAARGRAGTVDSARLDLTRHGRSSGAGGRGRRVHGPWRAGAARVVVPSTSWSQHNRGPSTIVVPAVWSQPDSNLRRPPCKGRSVSRPPVTVGVSDAPVVLVVHELGHRATCVPCIWLKTWQPTLANT